MASDVRDLVLADTASLDREIARVKQMQQGLEKLLRELLVPKVDYDRLPKTDKPTLLLPGAESINMALGLVWGDPEILHQELDWRRDPPFIAYMVKVDLIHRATGEVIATGIGACNSLEKKYRFRYEGEGEAVENLDTATLQNTILKMAVKRARIDSTLRGTGAGRIFQADLDDLLPQLEPASKKQLGFLEQLGKGLHLEGAALLAEVGKIVGHDVDKLENLTRQEASEAISKLKEALEAQKASGKGAKAEGQPSEGKANGAGKADSRGVDWTATWKTIADLGFTREEALEIAGVSSLGPWGPERVAKFIEQLKEIAAQRKAAQPQQGRLL